jgi:hypothetical protein
MFCWTSGNLRCGPFRFGRLFFKRRIALFLILSVNFLRVDCSTLLGIRWLFVIRHGRDAKGPVQQQSGSTAAVPSSQSSAAAGSGGAAAITPAAGAVSSGANVGWCHNGPDWARHKAGQCRYKH